MKLVALVTGGASGIGLATVKRIAEDGGDVVMLDLPQSRGQDEADKLGPSVTFVAADVTEELDVCDAMALVKSKFGRLDLVVNSAGISGFQPIFDATTPVSDVLQMFNKICKVNLFGTYNVVCQAGRLMTQNEPDQDGGRGVIINISSLAYKCGAAGVTAYSASKGGVAGLTNPLTQELAPRGIRVVALAPGMLDTPMMNSVNAELKEAITNKIAWPKRIGYAEEVAGLVNHIVRNKYINGTIIDIDAGYSTH